MCMFPHLGVTRDFLHKKGIHLLVDRWLQKEIVSLKQQGFQKRILLPQIWTTLENKTNDLGINGFPQNALPHAERL